MARIIGNRRLISVLIMATFFVVSIFAATGKVSAIDQSNNDLAVESCTQVQEKLNHKTEEFTQKRQNHLDKYGQISNIFGSITDTLNNAGYDVALLVELKPGLDRRIADFSDTSQVFINEMTDAANSACRDKPSFSQELEDARDSLKQVQVSVSGIQNYIQTIIVKSISNVIETEAN